MRGEIIRGMKEEIIRYGLHRVSPDSPTHPISQMVSQSTTHYASHIFSHSVSQSHDQSITYGRLRGSRAPAVACVSRQRDLRPDGNLQERKGEMRASGKEREDKEGAEKGEEGVVHERVKEGKRSPHAIHAHTRALSATGKRVNSQLNIVRSEKIKGME